MKNILLSSLIILSLYSCNGSATNSPSKETVNKESFINQEAKEEHIKKAVKESTEAFSAHNAAAAAKDFAPDFLDYGDGSQPPVKGVDKFIASTGEFFKIFPDMKGENLHYVADGNWGVVWGDWSATWTNDFMGQKPTGKKFKVPAADFFKFNEAGKIIEHRGIISFREIAKQIGLKLPDS
ncbi:hypothetical protein AAE02nite_34450 [Adhaeribacter aerolatus]|uniref:SnoaL-like domain-containing protein n=1 Tax=Adhaeribacter aerolatus TaxID=670289 RepID=A0A512B1E6_9BACT|nr:ester cyclase [Adhaeribacter aerolatus]GEO05781.1 hypothetical protein AAE02nite_34450 [Adhaeribacter aerolatus]